MPILENPLKSDSESANTAWLDALADIAEPSASPKPRTKMKQRRNPLFTNPTFSLSHNICDRFPSELHDQIIDHLHNDKHSLANCSLVCKAWLTSARYHLFQNASTIRIHRKNFPQFYELLATGRLSEYIGRLEIEQGGSHRVAAFPGEDGDDKVFQFDDHLRQFTGLASLKYLRLGWIDPNDGPELCIFLRRISRAW
ncbi:hypothetical protein B0H10DRAFT_1398195 [Mycena sp. CBHHK59/15]|nr:hypothetical protein B0H10DRAFT_1398195 [Mycena sp. CBHHK59/15]